MAVALLLLAIPIRCIALTRAHLYRMQWIASKKVNASVIVVGNVVVGGAGKTPIVIALAEHMVKMGVAVGVVSRGYGRQTDDVREVHVQSDVMDVGDEPLLIRNKSNVHVFVGKSRYAACSALMQTYPETKVIICDDGLQHYQLWRDLEICVFDDRGCGNGWTLPAGPLREPWPRQLIAAVGQQANRQMVVHTGTCPAFDGFRARRQLACRARRFDETTIALNDIAAQAKGAPIVAIAAIAQPEAFFEMLREQGVVLTKSIALADHANFDVQTLLNELSGIANSTLICTEKDAVKLWNLRPDAWAVPLEVQLDNSFWNAFDGHLARLPFTSLSSPHGYTTT